MHHQPTLSGNNLTRFKIGLYRLYHDMFFFSDSPDLPTDLTGNHC